MSIFSKLRTLMNYLFRRGRVEREMDEEFHSHLALRVADLERQGISRSEAERQARIEFGGYQNYKEECRETLGTRLLQELWQDIRYGLRQLRRNPGFTAVAVLILALGIGANTAVFSVVDAVLLRSLPFYQPQSLAWIAGGDGTGGLSAVSFQVVDFEELQRRNQSFQQLTAYMAFFGDSDYTLTGRGQPQMISGVMVAENFFQTLGIRPAIGRLFTPEECQMGGPAVALLSYAFWRHEFNADAGIVGKTVTINKQAVTVVGVLPPSFDFGSVFSPGLKMDIFVPAVMDVLRNWGRQLAILGRLKRGVKVPQAQAEVNVLIPQIKAANHDSFDLGTATVTGLRDHVSGKLRRSLIVLWCAVGLILLVACVNLSNMMLVRAAARNKEFAMRLAMGAGRGRLIRQLLTEGLVLAGAGTVLGLAIAFTIARYLAHQGSVALPLLSTVRLDATALLWTALIAVGAAMLFGLFPALRFSATSLQEELKDVGRGASEGRKHDRMRAILLVSEVALACMLLIGAGLLLRSFLGILDIDLGFQPSRAAAVSIRYDEGGNEAQRGAVLEEILRQVTALPGIESAAITDMLPLGRNRSWNFSPEGKVFPKGKSPDALVEVVTPGYFRTMGIHMIEGRDFNWQDTSSSEGVFIINETAARRYWPGQDPVGRLSQGPGAGVKRVIGVVSDVSETTVENSGVPEIYVPVTQNWPVGAELVVRTKLPPNALSSSVMKTLREINPGQPAAEFRPLQHLVDHANSPRRFVVMLVTSFALLGLLLASLGLYAVISYSANRRVREIGIRMALGAEKRDVLRMIVGQGLWLALIGVVIGTAGALALTRFLSSLLYGVKPTDPLTFIAVSLILIAVALLACYIPARRAAKVDPMVALRYE
jgi:putative ABC transport system permease protein